MQCGILLDDSSASLSSVTIQNSGNTALEINTTASNRTVTATGLKITNTVGSIKGIDANVRGAGVSIQNSMGNLNLGVAKIFNNSGPGLFVATSPNLTVGSTPGSTMETQVGSGLDLSNTKTALNFTSLKSVNSPGANHGIHLNNVTGTITSTTTNIVDSQAPAAILIENIPVAANSLIPKFGALRIESLFNNTEATNISLPGITAGMAQPIYTAPLTIVFP